MTMKYAVFTGASRGIGLALAQRLAAAGFQEPKRLFEVNWRDQ